jgi:DNA polymerase (family 10)
MPSELPNAAIADALEELGDLYELDGAIVHRVVAYRTGAKAVREAAVSVAALAREGRAVELSGVGPTLQEKILALLRTGSIPAMEKLRARIPAGLIDLTRLPGLGPKRARLLHSELGIDSLEALRDAAVAGKLRDIRGLGPKFEAGVISALERGVAERKAPRLLLPKALALGARLSEGLIDRDGVGGSANTQVIVAGSARRMADSVKDLDLVAVTTKPVTLAKSLAKLPEIESVSSAGRAGAKARTHSGVNVDLRIAKPSQLGNLLQHFTGSGRHNAALREAAVRRGLHVSEYGVREGGAAGRRPAGRSGDSSRRLVSPGFGRAPLPPSIDELGTTRTCASEAEVYELLGLAYIEPELRENRGELAAAAGDGLPTLIETTDLKGDLHCHTVASDGRNTIEQMALAARELGYEYLAITDHSASHGFGDDVSPDQLRRQIELVREANEAIDGIHLLAGSEVNILPDGSLDYEDELLAQLDWVIASVHTAFSMGEQAMTERMIAAIEHPLVAAIGHPTGRKIERRRPYAVDIAAVIAAAARTGTMLEINANPDRRDLNEVNARAAAQAGVRILIDSDAHGIERLPEIRWGVATARRAWLSAQDVANTRGWDEFSALRKRTHRERGT